MSLLVSLVCEVLRVWNGANECADLLAVLREQGSRRHGEVLEWIGNRFEVEFRVD
jgi:hypothetical protein